LYSNEGKSGETKLDIRFSKGEVRTSQFAFMFRACSFYIVLQLIIFKYLHDTETATPVLLEKPGEIKKQL